MLTPPAAPDPAATPPRSTTPPPSASVEPAPAAPPTTSRSPPSVVKPAVAAARPAWPARVVDEAWSAAGGRPRVAAPASAPSHTSCESAESSCSVVPAAPVTRPEAERRTPEAAPTSTKPAEVRAGVATEPVATTLAAVTAAAARAPVGPSAVMSSPTSMVSATRRPDTSVRASSAPSAPCTEKAMSASPDAVVRESAEPSSTRPPWKRATPCTSISPETSRVGVPSTSPAVKTASPAAVVTPRLSALSGPTTSATLKDASAISMVTSVRVDPEMTPFDTVKEARSGSPPSASAARELTPDTTPPAPKAAPFTVTSPDEEVMAREPPAALACEMVAASAEKAREEPTVAWVKVAAAGSDAPMTTPSAVPPTRAALSTSWPSALRLPVSVPGLSVLAVRDVKLPAARVVAPIVAPFTVPPTRRALDTWKEAALRLAPRAAAERVVKVAAAGVAPPMIAPLIVPPDKAAPDTVAPVPSTAPVRRAGASVPPDSLAAAFCMVRPPTPEMAPSSKVTDSTATTPLVLSMAREEVVLELVWAMVAVWDEKATPPGTVTDPSWKLTASTRTAPVPEPATEMEMGFWDWMVGVAPVK